MFRQYKYASALASSRGKNEDRVEVIEHGDDLVVVVADGAGGMRGGSAASDAVVSAVRTAAQGPGLDIYKVQSWRSLLTGVDYELARTMSGETTAVIVVVGPGGVVGVSVGDSDAWVIGETGIDDLTCEQNKKRLGSGLASPVSFFRPRLEGVLVGATDGLWNYAPREKITEAVRGREPADAAEGLRALVRLPSGKYQDDLGVVVLAPRGTLPA